MDWSELFRFEWLIIEFIVVGLLVRELVWLKRDKRRREAEKARAQAASEQAPAGEDTSAGSAQDSDPAGHSERQ